MIPDSQSLPEILKSAWAGKRYVLTGAALGLLLGVGLQFSLVPHYQAKMIIAPPSQSSEDRSLTILNENAASSRQMSVSSQVSRDYTKFQQTFREVSASRILGKYQGILNAVNQDRLFKFSRGGDIETAAELSDYIKAHVTIDPLGASTSQVISYSHPDAAFAEKFLRHLHKISDEMIRNDARRQTETRIAYLQKALREIDNPDHRRALTDQLMLEERQMMVISMDEPFSAEIVEPASASAKPLWPKASIILPVCVFMGLVLGFLVFSLKENKRT